MTCFLSEQEELQRAYRQLGKPFHDKFFARDYVQYLEALFKKRESNPEIFENEEISDDSVKIITNSAFGHEQRRFRYHLRVLGDSWEIFMREWECFACRRRKDTGRGIHGMGQRGANIACRICGGAGWRDPSKRLPPDESASVD